MISLTNTLNGRECDTGIRLHHKMSSTLNSYLSKDINYCIDKKSIQIQNCTSALYVSHVGILLLIMYKYVNGTCFNKAVFTAYQS